MFIAILTYKKPLEEVDRFLQAHRDYLTEHYTAGDFITSGPQTPRVGGVIMMKAENRTAVDTIIYTRPILHQRYRRLSDCGVHSHKIL